MALGGLARGACVGDEGRAGGAEEGGGGAAFFDEIGSAGGGEFELVDGGDAGAGGAEGGGKAGELQGALEVLVKGVIGGETVPVVAGEGRLMDEGVKVEGEADEGEEQLTGALVERREVGVRGCGSFRDHERSVRYVIGLSTEFVRDLLKMHASP